MKHFLEVMLSECAAPLSVCTGQATSTSFSEGAPRELHIHQNFIKWRWKQGGFSLSFVCSQCPVSQVRVGQGGCPDSVYDGRLGLVGVTRVTCSCWWWFSISWQLSNNPSCNVQLLRSKWLVLSRLLNSTCLSCWNNRWDELTWS